MTPVSTETLKALAALAPEEPKTYARQAFNGKGSFDLVHWIEEHALDVQGPFTWKDGRKWIFNTCPWNEDHTNRSAVIVQHGNGAIAAKCHHNGCVGKDWHALRDLVEPGWKEWWNKTRSTNGNGAAQEDPPNPDWGEEEPKKSGLTLTKLRDLLHEPEEKVDWLVDKTLPASGFSALVAKPKVGKSTLARNLALAVAQGRDFLGKKTQRGPVIYLALEEKRSEVKKHFQDMAASGEEEIYVHAASAPADALLQIRVIAEQMKPSLIIIDPLFRLTRIKDGNDYAQVTAALEPLLVLARETGAHVLCVHHAGKGDREGGDSILGSTAIFASVDTALMMKRSERYRTISSIQRYGEDLPETVLRFDPTTRTVSLGESKEQEEEKRLADAIVEFLRAKQATAEEAEIHAEVEGRKTVKVRALRRALDEGKIFRRKKFPDKEGTRGNPFLYALDECWFASSQYTSGNQGTSNEKENLNPQEDSPNAGSRDFCDSDDSAKSGNKQPEQAEPVEGCRFCGKDTCPLTPWGWLCRLSEEDHKRWDARKGEEVVETFDWGTGEHKAAENDGEVKL